MEKNNPEIECLNCGTKFHGNFCNNCGQQKMEEKTTVKLILSQFFQNVFFFDNRLYSTLVQLILRPGKTTLSYIEGKRIKYLQPIQFFLFYKLTKLISLIKNKCLPSTKERLCKFQ